MREVGRRRDRAEGGDSKGGRLLRGAGGEHDAEEAEAGMHDSAGGPDEGSAL
jgi:hypothetical protein